MDITELKQRPGLSQDAKLEKAYKQLGKLLTELKKREIPNEITTTINHKIEQLNTISGLEKGFKKQVKKTQSSMIKLIEKELKLVPKNHHRNTWMVLGMSIFGVPFGVAFGTALGNMGLLGAGIPIGMSIGMAIGAGMDKKAADEGRQLDLDIS